MRRVLSFTALVAVLVAPVAGTEVRHFQTQTREAFVAGTLEGISIDPLGRLRLADRAERLAAVEEPFLLAAAPHPDGWVVGTGNAGKVLKVDRKGKVTPLFTAPEPEVFAVRAEADGTVFAGTSPGGKVYRIRDGEGQVYFDPGATYIWSLERAADGALLVATGTEGKLYRVTGEGEGEVLFDSDDTHLRAMKALASGGVLLGTAEEGLVLRVAADGTARTLYDGRQPEVVALATAPGGDCYAALVDSEASLMERAPTRAAAAPGEGGGEATGDAGEPTPVVTVKVEGEGPPTLVSGHGRRSSGPRSVVLRIRPSGLVEEIWRFDDETVYALSFQRGRLWVGTGLEGKLYSWDGAAMVLEKDVDERQVVALMDDDPGPAFATTNAAALFRLTGGTERRGTYTSPALDAQQIARFGTLHWEGEVPRGGALEFSFRSGVSSEPDRTWSPWTEPAGGNEISVATVPAGRYVQWRARLEAADSTSPQLYGVELSYRQENLRPTIESLSVLDPGQVLVPANFNPASQVYEPAHPNREGIFTTLEPADADGDRRLKTLWKRGYRTLRWEASDPNEDDLVYSLAFRRADGDGPWLPVAEELEEDSYSFDATVLPDGVYRFRLSASDRPSDGVGESLAAELVSEPVVVDHSPPVLEGTRRRGKVLTVRVADGGSPLREAVVSFDAGEWQPVAAVDGLVDGRREELRVEPPEGARVVLLRLTDAAFNSMTFDLSDVEP